MRSCCSMARCSQWIRTNCCNGNDRTPPQATGVCRDRPESTDQRTNRVFQAIQKDHPTEHKSHSGYGEEPGNHPPVSDRPQIVKLPSQVRAK
jgi:hypothetical protein